MLKLVSLYSVRAPLVRIMLHCALELYAETKLNTIKTNACDLIAID
jgi:hypothetical protein